MPVKNFVAKDFGKKIHHLLKISSRFVNEVFTNKVLVKVKLGPFGCLVIVWLNLVPFTDNFQMFNWLIKPS